MEGVLLTTDTGLRNELLRLYQGGLDRSGCATMPIQGNTALNPACDMVHRHLCAAAVGNDPFAAGDGTPGSGGDDEAERR